MIARPSNTALPTQTVPVTAFLRGNNSETKAVTFTLPQAVLRSSLTLELRVLTNPDGSTLNFNTGPCGLGGTCRVPRGCDATQVTLPDGATYRRSVAIVVKG
jgi:hypothetical protein